MMSSSSSSSSVSDAVSSAIVLRVRVRSPEREVKKYAVWRNDTWPLCRTAIPRVVRDGRKKGEARKEENRIVSGDGALFAGEARLLSSGTQ